MANLRFVPSLESARGFAALTVCLFHASEFRFASGIVVGKGTAVGAFLNGQGAVILFFVLSGFVLRLSLEKKVASPTLTLAADFLIARVFRLFPIIVATVVLFLCVAWIFHGREPQLSTAVRNALLLDTTINRIFWTLQVEVLGSIIVLVAFLLERRLGISAVLVMLAMLLPLSFAGARSMLGPVSPAFFYTFLLGYLIAVQQPLPSDRPWLAPGLLGVALVAFYAAYAQGNVYKQWLLLVTAFSSALIVLALSSERYQKRLQWWPIRFLGMISYSFYALHPLGLQVDDSLRAPLERVDWPSWIAVAVILSVPVVVTLIVAIPMYYCVERPGVSIGRWVVARRRPGFVSALQVKDG